MRLRSGHPHPGVRLHVLLSALLGLALAACSPGKRSESGSHTGAGGAVTFSTAQDWKLEAKSLSPRGSNPLYFSLQPGFRYIVEGSTHPEYTSRFEVMVLEQTEPFELPEFGGFECAVVQTDELRDGVLARQVHEWVAVDSRTKAVYKFGAVSWDVDSTGTKVFGGMWRAGESRASGPRLLRRSPTAGGPRASGWCATRRTATWWPPTP